MRNARAENNDEARKHSLVGRATIHSNPRNNKSCSMPAGVPCVCETPLSPSVRNRWTPAESASLPVAYGRCG